MRQHIRDFIGKCAEYWDLPEPIYEFGSMAEGQAPDMVDLRTMFPGKDYTRTDLRNGDNVDVVLDLHNIELPDESVGTAICVETLEHVRYPWIAIEELCRVLKPQGVVIVTSCMHFPIHEHPHDYWRFTPDGLRVLMEIFEASWVDIAGDPAFPHTVAGIGWKEGELPHDIDAFGKDLDEHWIMRTMERGSACE